MSALDTQVGGSHYKRYAIQPFEFALVNGYDAGTAYILKHVTRHQDKLGREDLEKSIHYVEMRQEVFSRYNTAHFRPYEPIIPMAKYIKENQIGRREAVICDMLDLWMRFPASVEYPEKLKRKLAELADALYPVTPTESPTP